MITLTSKPIHATVSNAVRLASPLKRCSNTSTRTWPPTRWVCAAPKNTAATST
ncbi:MAG: hypothetical protein K0Q43_1878 [Ramlibacter sp.]|nr:hypothetical protein [Ramlibacter sp.]